MCGYSLLLLPFNSRIHYLLSNLFSIIYKKNIDQ